MIIVSNTSPLTNLAAINRFDLLQKLYGELHIADAVWSELNSSGKEWPGQQNVAQSDWIHHHTVENRTLVTALSQDLDQGEAETIALAIKLNADIILLDEKEGRALAKRFGLVVSGVFGLLLEAKAKGHLTEIRSSLDALQRDAGFYMSQSIFNYVLELANES